MKKSNYILTLVLFSTFLFTFSTSCKKKGCMDKYADNYSSKAEKDDGSCSYSKGALEVKAVDGTGNPITGEEIWIYNSQANYDNVNPMAKKMVDNSGTAVFTDLAPGHYWADCAWTATDGTAMVSEGQGDVELGKQTTITIKP